MTAADAAARHDALVRTLRRREGASVADLAGETGVSRRTVLRDIASLRDQGFVIHTESGRGGGVRLDPGSVQITARPSATEMFALIVSVATMRAAGTLPFGALADRALARVERGMPRERVAALRALLDCLHVGALSPHQDLSDVRPVDPGLLPAFEVAFIDRRPLAFRYVDRAGRETVREVEPQAMLALPPLWYVVAWDPSRGGFRHFRMDRIAGPEVLGSPTFRRRRVPFEDDVCPFREAARRP